MYVAGHDVDTKEMLSAIRTVEKTIAQAEDVTFARMEKEVFGNKGVLASPEFNVIRPGCDLFKMRLAKQLEVDRNDTTKKMSDSRQALIQRCQWYYTVSEAGPSTIVNDLLPFVRHTSKVLVLGSGSCLALALKSCVSVAPGVQFFILEGCPQDHGKRLLKRATESTLDTAGGGGGGGTRNNHNNNNNSPTPAGNVSMNNNMTARDIMSMGSSLPDDGELNAKLLAACTIVPDSAVAALMTSIDFVVVGANAVTEHGGLVHCPGTLQVAMLAKGMNVPFYALCETFKFSRVFPMSVSDLSIVGEEEEEGNDDGQRGAGANFSPASSNAASPRGGNRNTSITTTASGSPVGQVKWPSQVVGSIDLVPPELFTLLFTETGIITPSAVAHEMFRIFSGREADLH